MTDFKEKTQEILSLADVKINGNRPWDIQVHNEGLYKRVLSGGSLALGESYMDGWWDCDKLDELFNKLLSARLDKKIKPLTIAINVAKAKIINMQSKARSKKVVQEHYDLGNDFYEDMLGKTMQYTCAYWKNAKNLDQAQKNKLDLVCKKAQLKKGDKVLELGGGWGWFAKYATENYGCEVTSYNI